MQLVGLFYLGNFKNMIFGDRLIHAIGRSVLFGELFKHDFYLVWGQYTLHQIKLYSFAHLGSRDLIDLTNIYMFDLLYCSITFNFSISVKISVLSFSTYIQCP